VNSGLDQALAERADSRLRQHTAIRRPSRHGLDRWWHYLGEREETPATEVRLGGQGRAVLEPDILADRECVGPAAIRWFGNLGANITDESVIEAGFSGLTRTSTL
jgi:hypothetical protein